MRKKLRWGILSTASIALSAFLPGMADSTRGVVVAIASRSMDNANKVASEFDIPRAYGSYEELLSDPDVDAIYIPLPNHLHKEWTLKAAEAGKHVLCEKPAALHAKDAADMVEGCKKAGVIFAEAFMYRHHPKHLRLMEIIQSGELGTIQSIHGHFTYNQLEGTTDNVRYQKQMGGGAIYDVGCYPISAARMILEQEPVAVTVQARFSPDYDIDVTASGLVEFPNDVGLTFDCGMETAPRCSLEVVGTE
ncbi:oxidoreductase [Paenibacillus pini JCM 16418]|uniref:Oxidoreductase n=1 Tax=Paenibacillus pini JCM 16418 TaxID=1236976 RepID=W7YHF8_9BACL|nr:oxidoreductase [Paenibacillus pini JCM 16418]